MKNALLAFFLPACLSAASPAAATITNNGGDSAQFLSLGAGARALGMGEAYGAVAEGPEAIYWNPAGLVQLRGPELNYSHGELLQFFHHEFFAYAQPVEALGGAAGISGTFLVQDPLTATDNANSIEGSFIPHSETLSAGYARTFWQDTDMPARDKEFFQDKIHQPWTYKALHVEDFPWQGALTAGLAVKYLHEVAYKRSANAAAVDGGLLYRPYGSQRLKLALAFRNVGSPEIFINERQRLPVEIDLGACYDAWIEEQRLLPAFDVALPYYGDPYGKLGFEYSLPVGENARASLRLGYKTLSAPDAGPLTGLTAGIGAQLRALSLDFAFEPMSQLGEIIRGGVNYKF